MRNDKYYQFNRSLEKDFENIFKSTKSIWKKIKNKKIFLTGGTGFFGYWLIRSFIYANDKLKLNSKIYVLTRNKKIKKSLIYKLCSNRNIFFYVGDVRNFKHIQKKFDYIIHGATTSARETFKKQSPEEKFDVIVNGTKHVLDFALHSKCKNFLYISSGAVQGNENDTDLNILGQSKLIAENLSKNYSDKNILNVKIARCFSFVGPLIPLNIHYAIGNFLEKSVMRKSIVLNSSGKSLRSYMYMSDLTVWLWNILFKGKNNKTYEVGSNKIISIINLAKLVNRVTPNKKKIKFKKNKDNFTNNYTPSISKTTKDLNLKIQVKLNQAILKTYLNIKSNKSIYQELKKN